MQKSFFLNLIKNPSTMQLLDYLLFFCTDKKRKERIENTTVVRRSWTSPWTTFCSRLIIASAIQMPDNSPKSKSCLQQTSYHLKTGLHREREDIIVTKTAAITNKTFSNRMCVTLNILKYIDLAKPKSGAPLFFNCWKLFIF